MAELEVVRTDDSFSREDLRMILDIARKLSDIYSRTGFISIDTLFKPGVHVTEESFKDTFTEWQEEDFASNSVKILHELDGVEFYALQQVEREEEPEEEPEKQVHQETLPALQLNDQKVNVITMLIDFYRLKARPENDLDKFLERLRSELEASR